MLSVRMSDGVGGECMAGEEASGYGGLHSHLQANAAVNVYTWHGMGRRYSCYDA